MANEQAKQNGNNQNGQDGKRYFEFKHEFRGFDGSDVKACFSFSKPTKPIVELMKFDFVILEPVEWNSTKAYSDGRDGAVGN